MYKILLVNLFFFSSLCLSTTAFAEQIDLREAALLRRQQRIQHMAQVPEPIKTTPVAEGSLRERALSRRALRLKYRTTSIVKMATRQTILESINNQRIAANLQPLQENNELQAIVDKRLISSAEEFTAMLQSELDSVSFKKEVDDCDCTGADTVFRYIYFSFQDEQTSIDRFLERYKDVLLSNEYRFIGIGRQSNAYIVVIGGIAEIPITKFTKTEIINYREQILDLTNKERAKVGKPQFTINYALQETAQHYAERMWNENFYAHTSPEGGVLDDRINLSSYYKVDINNCNCREVNFAVGENIAKGQSAPQEVMRDWMNSPGHRKNILSNDFTEIGIGLYGNRWVQNFGAISYE